MCSSLFNSLSLLFRFLLDVVSVFVLSSLISLALVSRSASCLASVSVRASVDLLSIAVRSPIGVVLLYVRFRVRLLSVFCEFSRRYRFELRFDLLSGFVRSALGRL